MAADGLRRQALRKESKMWFSKPNIEALATRHDVRGLVKALKHRHHAVAERALEALKTTAGEEFVESIIPLLRHRNGSVRVRAARLLAGIKDQRALEPLVAAAVREQEENLKAELIDEVGELGDSRAAKALRPLLASANPRVESAAAIALGRLGDSRAVGPLVRMLREAADSPPWASRLIGSLGGTGDADAAGVLAEVLLSDQPDYSVAVAARDALRQILERQVSKVTDATLGRLAAADKVAAWSEYAVHAQCCPSHYAYREKKRADLDCSVLKRLASSELERRMLTRRPQP